MADVDVALAWIVMSVASVKGLSALARAAIAHEPETELTTAAAEGARDEGRSFHAQHLADIRP